jgi:hypothetical protein
MLTDDQLADHLRTRLRREVATIQPPADLLASLRRRARRSLTLRVTGVTAALAAAAATALVATTATGGGGAAPSGSAVLTATMVERVASASRLALAHSGRAKIAYRETDNGVLQVSGTDNIAFAGKNWNDAISQTFPARDGQHSHAQSAIDRIVNGRFYLYTTRRDGRRGWTRGTNPSGHRVMSIPDPRTLFGLLSPSAKFKFIGRAFAGIPAPRPTADLPARSSPLQLTPVSRAADPLRRSRHGRIPLSARTQVIRRWPIVWSIAAIVSRVADLSATNNLLPEVPRTVVGAV